MLKTCYICLLNLHNFRHSLTHSCLYLTVRHVVSNLSHGNGIIMKRAKQCSLTLSTRIISTPSTLCTRIFSVRNSN